MLFKKKQDAAPEAASEHDQSVENSAQPLLEHLMALRKLLTSCIISASAPTANNTVMFAAKYGRDTGLASKAVAVITFLSILTMPLMIALSQTV